MATAQVDGRFLPGYEDEFFAEVDAVLGPDVQREMVEHHIALETEFEGRMVDAACQSLTEADPGARVVPYTLSGGTDSKAFWPLGIRCFGFVPLQLPPDLNFPALFHGVDERVPVDALQFGVRVLDRFLDLV
jgi:acetylornithine deacetylase/succinyl-diaminopimelate desuccinylase-like protein